MKHRLLAAVLIAGAALNPAVNPTLVSAQSPIPAFAPDQYLDIVRRFNISVRSDGRYVGHRQRETRTRLREDRRGRFSGEFFSTEDTIRDLRTLAVAVQERVDLSFTLEDGRLIAASTSPQTHSIPAIPRSAAPQGWEAPATVRLILPSGAAVAVPTTVAYQPDPAPEWYQGRSVWRVRYGYRVGWPARAGLVEIRASRGEIDPAHLPAIDVTIRGSHQGSVLVPVEGGMPVLHRTDVEELVNEPGYPVEERRGFILTWYDSATVDARSNAAERLVQSIAAAQVPDLDVSRDALDRVLLSIQNLQFVADQAVLLPGENDRIAEIADLLNQVTDSGVLVSGHTADVGSEESQVSLSIDRARAIVDALIGEGVAPGRLRYEGRGGSEPVGDNATDEGRAQNRRVEIRILSD